MDNSQSCVVNKKYWYYIPNFVDCDINKLYEETDVLCKNYYNHINGKEYESKRKSCVIIKSEDRLKDNFFGYSHLPKYGLSQTSFIHKICPRLWEYLEKKLECHFDYCLIHIYMDGKSSINWHNDKEAMNSDIVSISFGDTRKFRLRKIGTFKGWNYEYLLTHGSLFFMKGPYVRENNSDGHIPEEQKNNNTERIVRGCQHVYQHCVPVEKKVKGIRINFTFRVFDN